MKVGYEIKITILEGEERGKVIYDKKIGETKTIVTEYGIIERLNLEWNYIHDTKHISGKENE